LEYEEMGVRSILKKQEVEEQERELEARVGRLREKKRRLQARVEDREGGAKGGMQGVRR
jgi:hypothetical protein